MLENKQKNEGTLVAIGDIHGCPDLLHRLLVKLDRRLGPEEYKLIFLGDYVDRGPDSRGVIEFLMELERTRAETIFLKGNHEEEMLLFLDNPHEAEAWLSWGGIETLDSYGVAAALPSGLRKIRDVFQSAIPEDHLAFLRNLKIRHDEADYVFVHAGLNPDYSFECQEDYDLMWIRDDFYNRGEGVFPGKTVIHGHTPIKTPTDLGWRINIDTGAVWSGKLSAVVIDGYKRSFITT